MRCACVLRPQVSGHREPGLALQGGECQLRAQVCDGVSRGRRRHLQCGPSPGEQHHLQNVSVPVHALPMLGSSQQQASTVCHANITTHVAKHASLERTSCQSMPANLVWPHVILISNAHLSCKKHQGVMETALPVQAPDAVGYALAAMDATGAAVVQGHCAMRNVNDGVLPGDSSCPWVNSRAAWWPLSEPSETGDLGHAVGGYVPAICHAFFLLPIADLQLLIAYSAEPRK